MKNALFILLLAGLITTPLIATTEPDKFSSGYALLRSINAIPEMEASRTRTMGTLWRSDYMSTSHILGKDFSDDECLGIRNKILTHFKGELKESAHEIQGGGSGVTAI